MKAKDFIIIMVEMYHPDDDVVISYDDVTYDIGTMGRKASNEDGTSTITIFAETDDEEDDDSDDEFDDEDEDDDESVNALGGKSCNTRFRN